MTTPDNGESNPQVDLTKGDPSSDVPFDPYRFGKPEHPVPPEYAPPGYTPPAAETPPTPPYGTPSPYGTPAPYGAPGQQPYAPPPPYGAPGQQPYGAPPPYGQYPGGYGAPPPPGYHGYVQPQTGNGKAVAALVLGILSIVFCWLSVFDAILVILAVIFGLIALSEARSRPDRGGRNMAIVGLACCVIGAVFATIITVKIVNAVDACGGFDGNNSGTVFENCIQDNF